MRKIVFLTGFILLLTCGCSADDSWLTDNHLIEQSPDSIGLNPDSRYIVILGDVQTYTMDPSLMKYFKASMEWVELQNSYFNNIDAILQVGDLTNDNIEWQWDNALLAMRGPAGKIPTITVPGNHDYTWLKEEGERFSFIPDRSSTLINDYALPQALNLSIVDRYEEGSNENVIYSLPVGGRISHIIALEFGPRREAVEWAGNHLKSNPDVDCYLLTHEWLSPEGEMIGDGSCYGIMQFGRESGVMSPASVWESIVKPNDNLIAVICGHNNFARYREDLNDAGRPVPQILFNLQYQENGGDSMLQLWEFSEDNDTIHYI